VKVAVTIAAVAPDRGKTLLECVIGAVLEETPIIAQPRAPWRSLNRPACVDHERDGQRRNYDQRSHGSRLWETARPRFARERQCAVWRFSPSSPGSSSAATSSRMAARTRRRGVHRMPSPSVILPSHSSRS